MTLGTMLVICQPPYDLKFNFFIQELIALKLGRAMSTTTFRELTRI